MNYLPIILHILFLGDVMYSFKNNCKKRNSTYFILILTVVYNSISVIWINPAMESLIAIIIISLFIILISYIHSYYTDTKFPQIWAMVTYFVQTGLFMLYRINPRLSLRQSLIALFAIILALFFTIILKRIDGFEKYTYLYYFIALGLLLSSNVTINGANNWFRYGIISFQPSEVAKIFFVAFLAATCIRKYKFKDFLEISLLSAILILVLVFKRDLGMAFIFYTIYIIITYIYSHNKIILSLQFAMIGLAGVFAYNYFSHVRVRLIAWLRPIETFYNEGYQLSQAIMAFKRGMWFGTGVGNGTPRVIPIVESDFILAAIGEEYGSIFVFLIILDFLLLIYMLYEQSFYSKNKFEYLVSISLTTILGIQAFLIMGGVIGLIPIMGVTLPFISYGGTSLVSSFILVSIVTSVGEKENEDKNILSEEFDQRARSYKKYLHILRRFVTLLYIALFIGLIHLLLFRSVWLP